jgi:hypothetical protein
MCKMWLEDSSAGSLMKIWLVDIKLEDGLIDRFRVQFHVSWTVD